MKRVTVFVLLLLICSLSAVTAAFGFMTAGDGGWVWQNPLPQGDSLTDVCFADAAHGWAVGEFGTILATGDGGTTWTRQSSGTSVSLAAVSFADAQRGWAVGPLGTVLATVDGGSTWTPQALPDQYGSGALDVTAIDTLHAWAVGVDSGGGAIFTTSDGGTTWTRRPTKVASMLRSITFADASHGWTVGDNGTVLATTDAGATWAPASSGTTRALNDVVFTDVAHGWVVGDGATVLATDDGGSTWRTQSTGLSSYALRAAEFTDASHGWAVGDQGCFVVTSDGGATWTPWQFGHRSRLQGVSFTDGAHGCFVGEGGFTIVTRDGGATWERPAVDIRTNEPFIDVSFVDASHGLAVGGRGRIVATSDGGATWTRQTSGTSSWLTGAYLFDVAHGWAVGYDGTILATTDGGAHWTAQSSGTKETLSGVCFVNASRGWAVGQGTLILATKNGGATWVTQKYNRSTANLYSSVFFVDASHGWAAGGTELAITTDGGATWNGKVETPCFAMALSFIDASRGWMVGTHGGLFATTDGGAHWKSQSPTANGLWGLCFVDALHGWAVGDDGTILATTSGGLPPVRTTAAGVVNGRWYKAPVAVTLKVTDNTGGVGIAYTEYKLDAGDWTRGRSITVSGEGSHVLLYRSADNAGNVEATRTLEVGIDTRRPSTKAPYAASVARYRSATLKYKVVDVVPNGGNATVTIKIRDRSGKTVKTVGPYRGKAVNKLLAATFTCKLAKGAYRFSVYATDAAGNVQTLPPGSNRLTVR